MKWAAFAGAALFMAIAGAGADSWGEKFYEDGEAAFHRGDYETAVDRLTRALLHHPSDARAQRLLTAAGEALSARQDLNRIPEEDLRAIIDRAERVLDERRREIRRALGALKSARRDSRRTTAEDTLRACRGVDLTLQVTLGDDPDSRRFRAYLHSLCANLEASLHAGVLIQPADEERIRGYVAFCRSEWDAAVGAWGRALESFPHDESLRALWAEAKRRRLETQTAARAADRLQAAETALREGRPDAALKALKEGLAEDPGNERMVALFEKTQARQTAQVRAGRVAHHRAKAIEDQRAERWVDAARSWLAVLSEDPLDEEARDALDGLGHRLETRPAPPPAAGLSSAADLAAAEDLYTRGLIRYAEGDLHGAAEQFRACLERCPTHGYARKALDRVNEERRPPP